MNVVAFITGNVLSDLCNREEKLLSSLRLGFCQSAALTRLDCIFVDAVSTECLAGLKSEFEDGSF